MIKDTGHEDRQEFDDSIDDQEVEEPKVEDLCAMLDYPMRDVTERAEMITSLKQFSDILTEDNSDDVVTRVEMCGGLAKIKQLRSHAHEPIRHKAQDILVILSSKTRSREGEAKESNARGGRSKPRKR